MSDDEQGRRVPSSRLSRLGSFSRLASGLAGGMVAEGARRLASGDRPRLRDMVLTPGNVARVADQLAHLRGAAMKLGQMISMDAGDLLPPELAEIMGRLRERAYRMPPAQLQQVLAAEWGPDWRQRYARFDPAPVAAASIGQVHRATTLDGRDLAIKVQYPGVVRSIDADIDNVATLLRVSGLLPAGLDIAPLLADAKQQLRDEADYLREGALMVRFGALLAGAPSFVVPTLNPDLTTARVLAMSFEEGVAVETLESAAQDVRDRVMTMLVSLVLRELFEFGVMQTDPNFANFRYQPSTGRLVLLDFGAARPVGPGAQAAYRDLLSAGLAGDRERLKQAAISGGILMPTTADRHVGAIDRVLDVILDQFDRPGPFDFGDRSFVGVLREEAMVVAGDRTAWHVPPTDMLFVQRKISGTALLAARLKARVDVRGLVTRQMALIEGTENTSN
jgi:predicted unusual protein kinase regulating ubiquinone biosynthesis (AarF/ABC1/UbiB family)